MTRAELKQRYAALPLPTTNDESWRFTDLKGFDPDSYASNGHGAAAAPAGAMLDVDVTGLAVVTESGIEIERAPAGIVFEPLSDAQERLGTLVGADDKFTAHNAASW